MIGLLKIEENGHYLSLVPLFYEHFGFFWKEKSRLVNELLKVLFESKKFPVDSRCIVHSFLIREFGFALELLKFFVKQTKEAKHTLNDLYKMFLKARKAIASEELVNDFQELFEKHLFAGSSKKNKKMNPKKNGKTVSLEILKNYVVGLPELEDVTYERKMNSEELALQMLEQLNLDVETPPFSASASRQHLSTMFNVAVEKHMMKFSEEIGRKNFVFRVRNKGGKDKPKEVRVKVILSLYLVKSLCGPISDKMKNAIFQNRKKLISFLFSVEPKDYTLRSILIFFVKESQKRFLNKKYKKEEKGKVEEEELFTKKLEHDIFEKMRKKKSWRNEMILYMFSGSYNARCSFSSCLQFLHEHKVDKYEMKCVHCGKMVNVMKSEKFEILPTRRYDEWDYDRTNTTFENFVFYCCVSCGKNNSVIQKSS